MFLPWAFLGRKKSRHLPQGPPLPALCPGAFVHLSLEHFHRAPQRLQAGLKGYWSGNPHCSFPQHMPRGLRTRNQEGPPHSPLLTVEKVGQVSQALLCSFHHSLRLSGSLPPNPALSCSTSVILKLSSVPNLTAPPLSWACLVSHGTLILESWGHKEQKNGREEEYITQPGNCPFSPAKNSTAGSSGASWCSLASPNWTRS